MLLVCSLIVYCKYYFIMQMHITDKTVTGKKEAEQMAKAGVKKPIPGYDDDEG